MPKPRPWWQTHPKKYWTQDDWKTARKAGAVPPLDVPELDPAKKLAYESTPKQAVNGGLYEKPDRDRERRRKVDDVLEKARLRPRRA
jgi:hypothetical protein